MLKTVRLLILLAAFAACAHISFITIYQPVQETTEERPLAAFPHLPKRQDGMKGIQAFFNDIDVWASDRMHYRQIFITWLNTTRIDFLGWSPMHKVVLGKDGWLFYNGEDQAASEDARGSSLYTSEELQQWKDYLLYRDREAKAHGAKFVFVMVPNKATVYKEFLPDNYTRLSDSSRLQQIAEMMKDSGVDVIDLRVAMLEGKKLGQLYLKSDTHWNLLGANVAQFEIMKNLAKTFPDIHPKLYGFHTASEEDLRLLQHPSDLLFMAGLYRSNTGQVTVPEAVGACVGKANPAAHWRQWPLAMGDCAVEVPGTIAKRWNYLELAQRKLLFAATELPTGKHRLLMVRDSFYEMLYPYFSNQFAYAEYVGLGRPFEKEVWTWMIEQSEPDIIIEEMVERNLKHSKPMPNLSYPVPK